MEILEQQGIRDVNLIYRYGVEYQRIGFEKGVVCYLPTDEPSLPDENLLAALVGGMQTDGCFHRDVPKNCGYRVIQEYSPAHRKRARSDIYYSEARGEFLKHPVIDRHAVLQAIAMNTLDRHVDPAGRLRFARSAAAVRTSVIGVSAEFSFRAPGVCLKGVTKLLEQAHRYDEANNLREAAEAEVKNLIRSQVPRSLRALCNDSPLKSPQLARYPAQQNVFVCLPGAADGEVSPDMFAENLGDVVFTLIDQAHPSMGAGLHYLFDRSWYQTLPGREHRPPEPV